MFIAIFSSKSFASEENFREFYTTSDGVSFYLDDLVLYFDDLNHEFIDSQEFIDYAYHVGYNRTSVISEQYNVFGKELTLSEIKLLIKYPQYAHKANKISEKAVEETKATADLYAYTNTNIPFNIPKTVYKTVSKVPGGATIRP